MPSKEINAAMIFCSCAVLGANDVAAYVLRGDSTAVRMITTLERESESELETSVSWNA